MSHPAAPYMLLLIAGAVLSAANGLYALRFRRAPAAAAFAGLAACSCLYALGYAFELGSGTLARMLFWNKVQYLGIAFIPFFWVLVAARFSGTGTRASRPALAGLLLVCALTLFFDWTNASHHVFYRSVAVDAAGRFPVIVLGKGPWYWVHTLTMNLALVAGNLILIRSFTRSPRATRRQTAVMMLGSALPWLFFLAYLAGFTPRGIDATPFALSVTGPVLLWGMFRYRIFDLSPVARESVFASMQDGAVVLDGLDRLVDFNPAAQRILGELDRSATGLPIARVLASRPEWLALMAPEGGGAAEIRVAEGEGERFYRLRLSPVRNRAKRTVGKVLLISDVTEQAGLNARLRALAETDELTGASNRRHFLERGRQEVSRAKRYGHPLSLVVIDLDHFKRVNDSWGHEAGDEVLRRVCAIIRDILRENDLFGRHGGEEFVILLQEAPPESAALVAERIRERIRRDPVLVGGTEVRITASFGVAGAGRITTESLEQLIREADKAMYEAKAAGRDCIRRSDLAP